MHVGTWACEHAHARTSYSCWISIKLEFSRQFSKKAQIPSFTEIHPVGAELFHADRQTDSQPDKHGEAVTFHNFANGPKNLLLFERMFRSTRRTARATSKKVSGSLVTIGGEFRSKYSISLYGGGMLGSVLVLST
jgi:hypothetical protein